MSQEITLSVSQNQSLTYRRKANYITGFNVVDKYGNSEYKTYNNDDKDGGGPIYAFQGESDNKYAAYVNQYLWEVGVLYDRSAYEWTDVRVHKYGNTDSNHYVDAMEIGKYILQYIHPMPARLYASMPLSLLEPPPLRTY